MGEKRARRTGIVILWLLVCFVWSFSPAEGAIRTSQSYQVPSEVISGGGGTSTSTSYINQSSIAQVGVVGSPSESASYQAQQGFWPTVEESACTSGQTRSCNTGLLGICADGTETCDQTGNWSGVCVQNNQPTPDEVGLCSDELDNDCDGDNDCGDFECGCSDIHIPDISSSEGQTITVPIIISNAPNAVNAFILDIGFNSNRLTFQSCSKNGTLTDGWFVTCNVPDPPGNIVLMAGADATGFPAGRNGTFVNLIFTVESGACSDPELVSPFIFERLDDHFAGWISSAGSFSCDCITDEDCNDGIGCTVDSCNPDGSCSNISNNAACDNGLYCDGTETCDATSDCQAGTAPDCDDGVDCTDDSCNEDTDSCAHTINNAYCDNGLWCDGAETCDVTLDCLVGTVPNCDDGIGCTDDNCNENNDQCVNAANNASCNDNNVCTDDSCDPVNDCQYTNNTDSCDDGLFCTDNDICLSGTCNGQQNSCDDGELCTTDSCDDINDTCVNTPVPDGTTCDDSEFCNGNEVCLEGACQAGIPPDCNDTSPCTLDSCDEVNDICLNEPIPDDTSCFDLRVDGGDPACIDDPGSGSEQQPYCTIQVAVNNAQDGCRILVAGGTYNEIINFDGTKTITVHTYEEATIDANGLNSSVVTFSGGDSSTLDGFTIINGTGNDKDGNGYSYGGGILCYDSSSPMIRNCIIRDNNSAYIGGGIACLSSSSPTITNCVIKSNSTSTHGGGIYCAYSSPIITNCYITGNTADFHGGGIACHGDASPTIMNCDISGNSAKHWAGGVDCQYNSSPNIINCTISGNKSIYIGGGIHSSESSEPTMVNSILWGNRVGDSLNQIELGTGGSIVVTYSDIQGGWSGEGNINCDPLFVDPRDASLAPTTAGNYHLQSGSCCIDAANSNPPASPTDQDGNPRYNDPNTPNTGKGIYGDYYDIGAYEFLDCTPQEIQICSTGKPGVCATGTQICNVDGYWDECMQDNQPSTEVCDGLDNDCDCNIDENLSSPTTCGVGECSGNIGEETCSAGVWGNDTCDPLAGATAEICDNLDNDCDGVVDDGGDNLCDDGLFCNGAEICDSNNGCQPGTAPSCSDTNPSNPCDTGSCNENTDSCEQVAANAGAECRPSAGDCDVAEVCDGIGTICPSDSYQADGTTCDDGLFCTENDNCLSGTCVGGTARICADQHPNHPCDTGECDEISDSCRQVSTNETCTINIDLNSGWNLISLNLEPTNTDIDVVLSSIAGKYISVWAYIDGLWKTKYPAFPPPSTLSTMESGRGYWIKMSEPGTLVVSGSIPSPTIPLFNGWNLVGYNSFDTLPIDNALSSIVGKYKSVWCFIDGVWKTKYPAFPPPSSLMSMEPYYGCWIESFEDCGWTLP